MKCDSMAMRTDLLLSSSELRPNSRQWSYSSYTAKYFENDQLLHSRGKGMWPCLQPRLKTHWPLRTAFRGHGNAGWPHRTRDKASGLSNGSLMGAQQPGQSGLCSPEPGHQVQDGGAAASSSSLPALSAPGLSGPLTSQLHGPWKAW